MSGRLRLLAPWILAAIVLGAIAARADFASNLAALLPAGDDRLGRELAFFEGQRATQLLALEAWSLEGAADQAVAELRAAGEALRPHGAEPLVAGGADSLAALERVLYDHLPALLPSERLQELTPRLSGAGLDEHLRAVRERAARPDDVVVAAAARQDLFGLAGMVMRPLEGHLPAGGNDGGVIRNPDGRHCLLLCSVGFAPEDAARTAALMSACDAVVATATARGVRIEAIGSYRHFRDNYAGIIRDLLKTLPVSIILVALLLYTLVRSWSALAAVHLPMAFAFLGGIAALVLCGFSVPSMLIGFAAGFLGISVENAIHMCLAVQAGHERAVRRPLLVGYLTTAVAFGVLAWSSVPALRCLGILVVVGLLSALAVSLWLLPRLVRRRTGPPPWRRATAPLLRLTEARPRPRLIAALALTALLVPGLFRLEILSDLRRMDGSRPETWAALEAFLGRWDSFETSDFLVAQASEADAALAAVAGARAAIGLAPSAVELLLPDRAEQGRRIAAWNAYWATHGPELEAGLRERLSPRAFAFFAPTLERYAPRESVDLVLPATWDATPFAKLLDGLVQRSDDGWRVASPLADLVDHRTPGTTAAHALEARLEALPGGGPTVWLASRADLAQRLVEVVRSDLGGRGLVMALAMLALVALIERSLRGVLAVAVPTAAAVLWTFGLMGWVGVPLTAFSVLVGAFVAGIGLDSAVFLSAPAHRGAAITPVLACTLTTVIGVGSLVTATNPLLANAGLALVIGMSCCLLACLLLTSLIAGPATGDDSPATGDDSGDH